MPLMVLPLYCRDGQDGFPSVAGRIRSFYASRDRGALRHVILPLVQAGVYRRSILVFIPSIGALRDAARSWVAGRR